MCAKCADELGVLLQCDRCCRPFVVCERCWWRQIYCGEKCQLAARREQCREVDRVYLQKTRRARQLRSDRCRRWRAKAKSLQKIDTDHSETEVGVGGICEPEVVSPVGGVTDRAKEGPTDEITMGMRCSFGTARAEELAQQPDEQQCAPGTDEPQDRASASGAADAQRARAAQPPSLDRCRFCGTSVRWLLDRAHLQQRRAARRRPARAIRRRKPRQPRAPTWRR